MMNKEGFLRFWEMLLSPNTKKSASNDDISLQFQSDFTDKVMQKIYALKNRQSMDLEEIKLIFYRFIFTSSAVVLALLIYTFVEAGSLDIRAIFGLTNDFLDISWGLNL